jgi:transcriptional regulator with XRE-family HTH domain
MFYTVIKNVISFKQTYGGMNVARLIIKEIATKQGLNQSKLQIKAGVTAQLLNRYWNNNTESVALKQLEMIAKALGVRSRDLIVDDDEPVQDEDEAKHAA